MATNPETGHAKNVANFANLLSFVIAYGAKYNPTKSSIKLPALQTMSTLASEAIDAVNDALPPYSNAVAAREGVFSPLNKFITRVVNAFNATDASSQVKDNVKTIARKIQGTRATPKKTEIEKAAAKAEGKDIHEISASQTSYDNRLDNLDKLIKLLTSVPLYAPNETDLKLTALTALYDDLKVKNTAVVNATTPLSNARIARNEILYKEKTGLIDTTNDIKSYIKSVFGATSPQFKQVSKIRFKSIQG